MKLVTDVTCIFISLLSSDSVQSNELWPRPTDPHISTEGQE